MQPPVKGEKEQEEGATAMEVDEAEGGAATKAGANANGEGKHGKKGETGSAAAGAADAALSRSGGGSGGGNAEGMLLVGGKVGWGIDGDVAR